MTARADLLALTPDDLAAMSNRGLVKRAQREHRTKDGPTQVEQIEDGTVTASYADGAQCKLSPGAVLNDRCCTCLASSICRHLLGAVLAYQTKMAGSVNRPEPWNPGEISDETLAKYWKAGLLIALRKQFDDGQVIEAVCAVKPVARFHSLTHTVRFLAPGDPRYTVCDCSDPPPCRHVPLAVWAFRNLTGAQQSGLIVTGPRQKLSTAIQQSGESYTQSLFAYGIAGAPVSVWRGIERLEADCRKADLVWPADILADLLQLREQYENRDARFSAGAAVLLVGEWLARMDALAANTGAAPELFMRGSSSEQASEIGTARLVGIGCGLRAGRRTTSLSAYLQDAATGTVVSVRREVVDSTEPYSRLARFPVWKSATLSALGSSQILSQGGKRSASGLMSPSRAPASVMPQSYQWEKLRPPVLVESAAELLAHRKLLPPALLRPRRLAEDLHVFPVDKVENAGFIPHLQEAQAQLHDAEGGRITLIHPFHARGRGGMERLLAHLGSSTLRFVAGNVRLTGTGIVIAPIGMVFETAGTRWLLQPWADEADNTTGSLGAIEERASSTNPIHRYWGEVQEALGELLLKGIEHADSATLVAWNRLAGQGNRMGLVRSMDAVKAMHQALDQLSLQVDAPAESVAELAKKLSVMVAFALCV